jgi:hypothetical protein
VGTAPIGALAQLGRRAPGRRPGRRPGRSRLGPVAVADAPGVGQGCDRHRAAPLRRARFSRTFAATPSDRSRWSGPARLPRPRRGAPFGAGGMRINRRRESAPHRLAAREKFEVSGRNSTPTRIIDVREKVRGSTRRGENLFRPHRACETRLDPPENPPHLILQMKRPPERGLKPQYGGRICRFYWNLRFIWEIWEVSRPTPTRMRVG